MWKLTLPIIIMITACSAGVDEPIELFNGEDLDGWNFALMDDTGPADVWSVRDGAVYCTGIPNGFMYTETPYSDYELTLEWRWPEEAGNSGVLLHIQEPAEVWPTCIECQLKSGFAGDFVLMNEGALTVRDTIHTNTEQFLRIAADASSAENPAGEWNTYHIVCSGGAITCSVNGVLMNAGEDATVDDGYIGLQSEGAPIMFRRVTLTPLE